MMKIRGKAISMVFQDPMTSLNPLYTIEKQITEMLDLHQKQMTKQEKHARCVELLHMVGIPNPEDRLKSYPHQFSGGMRQRVIIAIALAANPKLIIADEPTTALDVTIQAQILKLMDKLVKEQDASLILITHDLAVVSQMADRIIVMYCGKIVESGSRDDVIRRPSHPYTEGLLNSIPRMGEEQKRLESIPGMVPSMLDLPQGCYFAPRCKYCQDICRTVAPESHEVGPGHCAACHFPLTGGESMSKILQVENLVQEFNLTKDFLDKVKFKNGHFSLENRVVHAVNNVSFDVEEGEVFSLVGESGCGKSTTARTIIKLIEPKSGKIIFDGRDITRLKPQEMRPIRREMQMIFQDPYASLNPRQKIMEILTEPMLFHKLCSSKAEAEEKAIHLLERVGLSSEQANRYPHQFSGGQRQRIGIARALAVEPKFIIADEPVSALDVSIQLRS